MVRAWVGWVCSVFYVVFCVWPGMVLNQRQVSLVVSDWESYLGSLFSTCVSWVFVFRFSVCRHTGLFNWCTLFCFVPVFCCFYKKLWTVTTLRFGPPILLATPPQKRRTRSVTWPCVLGWPSHFSLDSFSPISGVPTFQATTKVHLSARRIY